MASPANAPVHDLGSLRIHEGARKGGKLGKGLAIFFGGLVVLAGLSGGIYAFYNQKPVVEVTTVQKPASGLGGREALLNASGYVTPRRRATIAAKITGRVTGVFFDEGTRVHEGQLLATLDDSDAKKALDAATADHQSAQAAIADYEVQLKNARIVLHRAEQLQKAGVQTQEQLDNARTGAHRGDASEGCRDRDIVIRIREVRLIEEIEKLRTKFAPDRFGDWNEFHYREIHIPLAWAVEKVASRVAKNSARGKCRVVDNADAGAGTDEVACHEATDGTRANKCTNVEILIEPRLRTATTLGIAAEARREVCALNYVVIRRVDDRERSSGLKRHDTVQSPLVQQPLS